ncbi:MAG: hypothetical protein GYA24_13790 [Candidatus Lokiarchaeota archaeon]|nr:hypothetical protein [Candidatus Lokiarchaeota archaeon]
MHTNDYVTPFYSSTTPGTDTEQGSLAMDLTMVIVKLYFETKGNIEKKLGDIANIAVGYWPFYIVPINANNAYILEGRGLYSERIRTRVLPTKLPALSSFLDEGTIDRFISSMDKFVGKCEGFQAFEREEKKIDGLIPVSAFQNYFLYFFKNIKKPYLDTSFSEAPSMSDTAVKYMHDEILKIFDDEPITFMKQQHAAFDGACKKWIATLEANIKGQVQDPVQSLKTKGEWLFPELAGPVDQAIDTLKGQTREIRASGKNQNIKASITLADQAINSSNEIAKALEDYRRNLKNLDDRITSEKNAIESERKYWQDSIEAIRKLQERMLQAMKGFEDQENVIRSKFLAERTISFKSGKVATCGMPFFLLNFIKKGKQETRAMAPVILEEVSMFHKNPFKEPKGFSDFEKAGSDHFTKAQNAFEVQSNMKKQDIFTLPNLKIDVSNGIDRMKDLGYLDKKKHAEIRDDELHNIFTKG